ncbi:MAG: sugar ABC transporter substrate-binding protein [Pseudomonas sp. PGPPP1]|uniref:Substrate-binding domain-containing protein n=2 Tax=Gammaproteobacteria TaxID=1236 RepID=A0A7X1AP79_9PSED|nr:MULTISPECIES: substrate-binding domain-containing protein [Pseudomonas]MBC2380862.1 substrate-binding domain-containing protein [Pseudomonas cremoris]MBC2408090.1 substrate-binding domain-containing protein [Pseudomonas cremoris]OYU09317.1 MAG: sugar ABC transporter substrate-binding protein [Pseudomonas sp. PGPPP1]
MLQIARKPVHVLSLALAVAASVLALNAQAKDLKIGFSQVTLQSPFYVQLRDGAKAAAAKDGDELIFLDANGDISKQNNDIQDLLTRKVDVLIINAVNPDAVGASLDAAKRAKVPVIAVDRAINAPVAATIGRNNAKMGELSGQALVAALKQKGVVTGKIIEIQGDAGGTVMQERRKGFHTALAGTDFKIIEGPYSEYMRANAVTAMQDLLQAHPDLKAVIAHNDDMAMGALQVLNESGKKNVLVAGVDGLSEAINAIQNGDQYVATALNDPRYLGEVAIEAARGLVSGKTIPAFVDAGTKVVTKADAAEIKHDATFGEYRPGAL